MNRTQAVKMIYNRIKEVGKGLPDAIETYKYLSCYGQIEVTREMIKQYFGNIEE